MKEQILVISSAQDATANYLCDHMARASLPFARLDTETLSMDWALDWSICPAAAPLLRSPGWEVDLGKVRSVWYRRPLDPLIPPSVTDPAVRQFLMREWEAVLAALWQGIEALWVNNPSAIRYASRKPHQLQRAAELGFSVPETLLTSDPDRAQAFWAEHPQGVIFKPLHQEAFSVNGQQYFVYTTPLTEDRLEEVSRVIVCPTLLQAYIEPKLEIRATVIGRRAWAAALDTATLCTSPDWRRLPPSQQPWQPQDLPSEVERRCVDLVRGYNLHFGAIDLILTPTGEYHFLELNPNGQWVWIELIAGVPLTIAMLHLLAKGK